MMLVADIARRNRRFFAADDAVLDVDGRRWSWTQLDEWSTRLAHVLVDHGAHPGDRVAMLSPNDATCLSFFFSCSKSGILGAPLNIRLTESELGSYLAYVEPTLLLVHASQAELGQRLADACITIRHTLGFGGDHGCAIDLDDAVFAAGSQDGFGSHGADQPYMLAATSGTTGVAKAAVLTNANALAAISSWMAEIHIAERQTALQNIPQFFNPGGPAGIHPALVKGGRMVIYPGFDPAAFLDVVPRFAVQHTILVPTMIRMVLDHPAVAAADLSSLRSITCGGSPVSKELLLAARPVFGDVFYPTYGMAETYSCGLVLRPENQRPEGAEAEVRRLGSAGKPHIGADALVLADNGTEVAFDGSEVGEVLIAGDMVAGGYFRMPEETAAAFVDGWMHSGDLATVDDGGFITIVGRKKDVIITGGINVHSREVEEVLLRHPHVAQAAAIGVPHPQWGEAVHAVVVATHDATIDVAEVLEFCAVHLASYKKPRSLEVRRELPISATGKVLKRVLRDTLAAGSAAAESG